MLDPVTSLAKQVHTDTEDDTLTLLLSSLFPAMVCVMSPYGCSRDCTLQRASALSLSAGFRLPHPERQGWRQAHMPGTVSFIIAFLHLYPLFIILSRNFRVPSCLSYLPWFYLNKNKASLMSTHPFRKTRGYHISWYN